MSIRELFTRTECGCKECIRCCYQQPGPLASGDAERITDYISETQGLSREVAFEKVKAQLWASPGALVKAINTNQIIRVGTITPRRVKSDKGRRCVFLDDSDRCTIHPVAPFGCAFFDTHMSGNEAHKRGIALVQSQMSDPEYRKLRDELPYAQSYKPKSY